MGKMIVYTNIQHGREAEFHEWYESTHLPEVLALGPFKAAQRFAVSQTQVFEDQSHVHVAIYEFEGSAEAAREAMLAGSGTFQMSDAMCDPPVVILEESGVLQRSS